MRVRVGGGVGSIWRIVRIERYLFVTFELL